MTTKHKLHFALMCNRSNGGFDSAINLIDFLSAQFEICAWSLYGELYDGHAEMFESRGIPLLTAAPVPEINTGEHVFIYMNDYPAIFRNFSKQWQLQLNKAGSVQIGFNRTLGSLPLEDWLAGCLDKIYFLDTQMQSDWSSMVRNNQLSNVPTEVLPPPVILDTFLEIPSKKQEPIVFGRLAGDGAVPVNGIEFYQHLAAQHPEAEFWFMPAAEILVEAFADNPQFKFYNPNEISVNEFFTACDIYMLTYQDGVPIPGPRSLIEAMAASCAPIVVNREGPKDRVVHGVSGFCADTDDDFYQYAELLVTNSEFRTKISIAARERAQTFKAQHWIEKISYTILNAEKSLVE